jgi:hypothetical protein
LDFLNPCPIHEIKKYIEVLPSVICPVIFVNTSNHAMATHDTNEKMSKQLFTQIAKNSIWRYGTRAEVELKYKNSKQYRQRKERKKYALTKRIRKTWKK